MFDALMQRGGYGVLSGALLASPANGLTGWMGSAGPAGRRGRGADASGSFSKPAGSNLVKALRTAIIAVRLLAVTPLVLVLVAGIIYSLWRLAWLLMVAHWRLATAAEEGGTPARPVDDLHAASALSASVAI